MDDSTGSLRVIWQFRSGHWRLPALTCLSIDTPRNVFCESGLQSFVAKDDVLSVYVLAEANSITKYAQKRS